MKRKYQISNIKYQIIENLKLEIGNSRQRQGGFTLIELLAVMVVLIVIGGIIGGIFFASLRGTNKLNNLISVRQAGNLTTLQITKLLRFAKRLDTPASCAGSTSSVTVTQYDDTQVTLACTASTIASNGASMIDTSLLTVTNCAFTCTRNSTFSSPVITINFDLKKTTTNSFVENKAELPFQATVTLQNIH